VNAGHRFALLATISRTISTLPGALQRCGDGQRRQASGPNTLSRTNLFSDNLIWRPFYRCSASCRRQRTERRNGGPDFLEQTARQNDLSHLNGDGSAAANDLRADLHQPVAQRGHGPLFYLDGQRQVRRKLARLYANACNWSGTAFALKLWQDSRVQAAAPRLP
jgi:hypothetical protein